MEWVHLIFHVILVFHLYTIEAQSLETTTISRDNLTIMFVGFLSALILMALFALLLRHCSSTSYSYNCNLITDLFRRGFNRRVINKCPILVHSTGKTTLECAICLNEFQHNDKIRLLPKCYHVFHRDCIDVWLLSHMNCPICRSKLIPNVPESEQQQEQEHSSTITVPGEVASADNNENVIVSPHSTDHSLAEHCAI
ncbi:putative transcription factor C2H2 family [Medicago truncatula]|uniref:RING-type E3 ubiquitin transferase n=1 Tax=Medicago truncatula TaxID=3880 RepID=A0A072V7I9_MEDTR|nr:E3 ubiquitin-protein ligase ATL6 [Medicago truncatula]KEH38004.1 zinc finger, C3HC4 type (RING finger) protein [Medicago truncatula]RHN74182.1 putative transcription factor C2H2 family [Medicago truncatula]